MEDIFIKLLLLCDLFRLGIINDSGDFRLLNRKALNLLINTPCKIFVRALVPSIDVKQFTFKYNRKPRNSGIQREILFGCVYLD